jgi:GxxExxY protein
MDLYLYKDLSYLTIGAAIEVHKVLGPGFLESVYEQALAHEFSMRNISFLRQAAISVRYKDIEVGKYRADFFVENKIILEIKAVDTLVTTHESQAHHYLIATGLRLAILLNFGSKSLQVKRIIR